MHLAGVKESASRSRLVVLAAVISLHASVFILLVNLRTPSRAHRYENVSLLWLPPHKRPEVPVRPPPPRVIQAIVLNVPPTSSFSAPSAAAAEPDSQPLIDWAQEAVREAGVLASNAITPPSSGGTPSQPAPGPFQPPPAHHAGESYRNEVGETIVWISDKCYQVSGTLLTVPDVMAHAMLPRTICPRASNKPRGDLFKDLPAYRKLHPGDH